jgi:hypothetical protein
MAIPKQSEVCTTKQQHFHVDTLGRDLQTKKRHFLIPTEEFFSKAMPYLVSSCFGNHRVFLGSLVLSQSSRSTDLVSEEEDKLSYTYGIPLHRWIDHVCGYTFRWDDWAVGFSLHQDFLSPTHLHEFLFMIDYIYLCS